MLRSSAVGLALAACIASTAPARAGTTTAPLVVTATVLDSCVVVATPMAFGTLSLLSGSANDSTATITLTCTPFANYDVSLDNGLHASGGTRRMQNVLNSAFIPYEIYSDSSRTARWGSTSGSDTISGSAGLVGVKLLTAYGRIPGAAAPVKAGIYDDVVTVAVTF